MKKPTQGKSNCLASRVQHGHKQNVRGHRAEMGWGKVKGAAQLIIARKAERELPGDPARGRRARNRDRRAVARKGRLAGRRSARVDSELAAGQILLILFSPFGKLLPFGSKLFPCGRLVVPVEVREGIYRGVDEVEIRVEDGLEGGEDRWQVERVIVGNDSVRVIGRRVSDGQGEDAGQDEEEKDEEAWKHFYF